MGTIRWRRGVRGRVARELASLGNDAAEVAQRLQSAGVAGTPSDAEDCAIAMYLSAIVAADPAIRTLRVSTTRVVVFPARRWQPAFTVALPDAVRAFIAGFDARKYPRLIRERSPITGQPKYSTSHSAT